MAVLAGGHNCRSQAMARRCLRCNGEVSEGTVPWHDGPGLTSFSWATGRCRRRPTCSARHLPQHNDLGGSLAHSFYAEVAAARGDTDEGRRRRVELLDHYLRLPDSSFVVAARAYSRAKLAGLDGDLQQSEHYYREAAHGFGQIDRPMMLAMCQGIVADFDERSGNYRAAIENLDEAIATNDTIGLRGFNASLLARLGWALLQDGDTGRAEVAYDRALDLARRLSNTPVIFLALAGRAVLQRTAGHAGGGNRGGDRSTGAVPGRRTAPPRQSRGPSGGRAGGSCGVLHRTRDHRRRNTRCRARGAAARACRAPTSRCRTRGAEVPVRRP